jgi:hypothetical protein
MADELNIPTHRYYQPRYNVALAKEDISAKYIYDSGIRKIDARIGEVEVREPLFLNSEPGAWYDPSDLTTMFQDRAGTTPVTAAGQSVGLRLDKSKGLVLGPELVTNGTFDSGTTGWTTSAGTFVSTGGQAVLTSGTITYAYQSFATTVGVTYVVEGTIVSFSGGAFRGIRKADNSGASVNVVTLISNTGSTKQMFAATAATTFIVIQLNGTAAADSITVDNISVKELPGNHAVANSDAARGIYGIEPVGGRRNLLTFTEQFDNAAWAKENVSIVSSTANSPVGNATATVIRETATTSNHTISWQGGGGLTTVTGDYQFTVRVKPDGRDVVTLSFSTGAPNNYSSATFSLLGSGSVTQTNTAGALTSARSGAISLDAEGFYLCQLSVTVSAGTGRFLGISTSDTTTFTPDAYGRKSFAGSASFGILIWGAQLETGSTATAYQRVTTQYDVTEAGVPSLHYVQYDGADDGYVTPTITPNTDKVQVFAGVRKLSDAAPAVLAETSISRVENTGAFTLLAPTVTPSTYAFTSKGTIDGGVTSGASFASPITSIVSAFGDISGDASRLRINGSQVAETLTDQGTGNYLAYPMYIGRRGGTTFPFNGRDYGLIVRFGPNLDANTISNVEKYLAQKTGVTL